jgi:hypothetical protein
MPHPFTVIIPSHALDGFDLALLVQPPALEALQGNF